MLNKYQQYFKKELAAIIGREITLKDGFSQKQLDRLLNETNIKIPSSLYQYYHTCGKLEINKEHHNLYNPSELEFIDNYLVFMEENQRVVIWGFNKDDLNKEDPIVYQGQENEETEWYPEEMEFSKFIIDAWKFIRGKPPYDRKML
jgi:hypothetical protein